ncbi:uncharacterized protein TNCV_4254011 [Trichonephila clavipes]|nr:uncharacterized protein TNCV_4254011 [Trichonephila clavipes]
MTGARGHGAIVYCLNSGSEERLTGRHNGLKMLYEGDTRNRWRDGPVCPAVDKELWRLGPDVSVLYEGDTRNRWRDGPVCPAVDKELWRLGPDVSAVRSAGCKVSPVPACEECPRSACLPFFPEKDKEEVSSVFTCNVKGILKERQEARELKEMQEARELKERQKTREYDLKRLRLSNATETVSVSSADLEGQGVNRRVNLKDLVPKFDAKNADINLFFEIFERQAIKEKVAEDRWVSQLIPLLPIEIAEIVAKEPLEKSDDYPHIKNLLLTRFQLTPIALRDRFESHQRRPGPCGRI